MLSSGSGRLNGVLATMFTGDGAMGHEHGVLGEIVVEKAGKRPREVGGRELIVVEIKLGGRGSVLGDPKLSSEPNPD